MYINNTYHFIKESAIKKKLYETKKRETQMTELFLSLPNQKETDPVEMFSKF